MHQRHDGFTGFLKDGTNLKTLNHGKLYFRDIKSIRIVRYLHSTETPQRVARYVSKEMLSECRCQICGSKLYRTVNVHDVNKIWGRDDTSLIQHGRHLVFVDNLGKSHKTCYKLASCLKGVGFIPGNPSIDDRVSIPDFYSFLGSDRPAEPEAILVDAEESYMKTVVPFMLKWAEGDINKRNVIRFNSELSEIQRTHFRFYDEGHVLLLQKILKVIGVTNE